jgi:hypothetical protein
MLQGFYSVKIFWPPLGFAYFEKWNDLWSIFFVMMAFDLLCVFTLVV